MEGDLCRAVSILPLLMLVGCGIAGSSWDSQDKLVEALRHKTKIGQGVVVRMESREYGHAVQQVPLELDAFAHHAQLSDGQKHEHEGLEVEFLKRRVLIRNEGLPIMDLLLPEIFDMHPLVLAVDEIAFQQVILIANPSRSTSGLFFVVVIDGLGSVLFESVLTTGQMWSVSRTETGMKFLGSTSVVEVVLSSRGIAGAGFDSPERLLEARQRLTTIGEGVLVKSETRAYGHAVQQVPLLLDAFAHHAQLKPGNKHKHDDMEFEFLKGNIRVQKEGRTLIDLQLPRVFDMHPLVLAVDRVANQRVFLLANPSRSSSGLYFVALVDDEGRCLYESVLMTRHMWNVAKTESSVVFLGATSRIEVVVPGK